jgi:hypothetical protein
MKTINIILLLFLSLLFYSCSKNDDDNSCISDFLECYDGTKWSNENHQDVIYRFSNDVNRPIEMWITCLPNSEGYFYYDSTNFELIENTKGKLRVKEFFGSDIEHTYTFETDGNQLTLRSSPQVGWGGIGHLTKTSIEVYDLEGCN